MLQLSLSLYCWSWWYWQSKVFSNLAPAADVREAAAAVPVVVPAAALPTILIPTVLKQDTYFTFFR